MIKEPVHIRVINGVKYKFYARHFHEMLGGPWNLARSKQIVRNGRAQWTVHEFLEEDGPWSGGWNPMSLETPREALLQIVRMK